MNLFDIIEAGDTRPIPNDTWRPEAPPSLDDEHEIEVNVETTGLKWWEDDRPLAISVYAKGRAWYLPFRHRGLGNLDEAVVKRWAQRELRGKRITNINTRFDIHMLREWGVDLEAQDNEVSDVGHSAALLDDHRYVTNLDSLIQDFLGEDPMQRLDESKMRDYSAGMAAPRAMYNVEAVNRLRKKMRPLLEEENLLRVHDLEDKVIYVTCEMEKNGAPIDLELLDRWVRESQKKVEEYLWKICRAVGFQVNPDSSKDVAKVFQKLKIPPVIVQRKNGSSSASFSSEILNKIDHPIIQDIRKCAKLMSLRSKYLVNTKNALDSHGILRYSLHQLRVSKDENAEAGDAGTVTGRFSSAKPVEGVGCNIQQRMKAAKQRVAFGFEEDDDSHDDEIFLIRKLHIAQKGQQVLSSDMDQAQYRIFAHYVNNPKVIQAYKDNPNLSFHKFMHKLLEKHASLTYRQQKDLNFAVIFGAGLTKMSLMLGHITQVEYDEIKNTKNYNHPKLVPTKLVKKIYDREIPEVKDLLARWSHMAKPRCDERCRRDDSYHATLSHMGHVETYLGRRMRFPDGNRMHKAFNGTDQGTEADYNKTKLVELHAQRKHTGLTLRITNHDECVGDVPDAESARRVNEILNSQSFPELRVPLTWSTSIGPNWADQVDI